MGVNLPLCRYMCVDWNTHRRQEAGKETIGDFKKKAIESRCYKEVKGLMGLAQIAVTRSQAPG